MRDAVHGDIFGSLKHSLLGMTASFEPLTEREKQIVKTLGKNKWKVKSEGSRVPCLGFSPGLLLEKENHMRWVRMAQITITKL